jgi:hypothetical protein
VRKRTQILLRKAVILTGYIINLRALYTLSQTERFYCVTSYLTEKLGKLRSFDRQASEMFFSSRLSHTELCSSLRESHSFLSLPADATMASSQGTSVSNNSFSRWASLDIFLFKYHFLLHILRFLFFFSDNIMDDVASKQQTTALFLSTVVTRTRRHTELTKKKLTNLMGNLCCAREYSVQFFLQFFYTVKLHSLT